MKTTAQLVVGAVALFTSSAINVVSVYSLLHRLTDDARVVNHAGIVRGATQRLVKLELGGEQRPDIMDKLDLLVNGLISGDKNLACLLPRIRSFWQKCRRLRPHGKS